jgi:hypothetical protein
VGRLLARPRTQVALLAAAALMASACGSASPARQSTRTTDLESMIEAQGELLADPGGTLDLLRRIGVARVRVFLPWSSLAPDPHSRVRPVGLDLASPTAYPAAGWGPYDAIVRDATARRIGVLLTLEGPPPLWASGRGAPANASEPYQAVWEPSASEYGAFVRAVATRYSGRYTPSGASTPIPRVSFWSIWNEPNYGPQLAPQAIDHSTVEVSPLLYRRLLDAAWSGLQATGHGSDTILIGELAPRGITTGDNPGNFSGMVPLRFLRALYCVDSSFSKLRGPAAAARGCPTDAAGSAQFAAANPGLFKASAIALHPYPSGGVPPDVATAEEPDYADLASLPTVERTLDRLQEPYGSSTRFPIYSTEFGYQTNPPENIPRTTDPATAAYYLNWAEYISWRDPRLRSWNQYLLRDPSGGNFASGLEFADGRPKPAFFSFRMPIYLPVTSAARGQSLEVWGCVRPVRYRTGGTPQAVRILFRPSAGSGGYKLIQRVPLTDPDGYFDTRVAFPSSGTVRSAWSYPGGQTIRSRTVSVSIR